MEHPFNLKNPIHLLAVGFGSGLSKYAPGTFGTLAAIPFYFQLVRMPSLYFYIAVAIAAIVGIYICGKCAKDIGEHDHSSIVWDEFVGLWITLLFCPVHWIWAAIGFGFFRLFDILKPFPINLLDKHVRGGFGIMVDDVLAGIFAMLCLQLTIFCYGNYYLKIPTTFFLL